MENRDAKQREKEQKKTNQSAAAEQMLARRGARLFQSVPSRTIALSS
jgi:hypothetical protein